MPYEASVGDDGYFILPIQLVRGYNKLTFEIYGKTKESGKQYLNFVMEPQDGFVMEFMPVVTHAMSGTIHVGNNSGPALSGATVSIAGLSTTTNSAGTFTIIGIPAGTYAFSVSKPGYDTYTNPAYYVGADQSGLNFYLAIINVDPLNAWHLRSSLSSTLKSVVYGNNAFVAVGGSNVANSLDGVSWSSQYLTQILRVLLMGMIRFSQWDLAV